MKNVLLPFYMIFLVVLFLQCPSDNLERISNTEPLVYKVVIDPGHGGKDPGAISGKDSLREKDIVLELAKIIKQELELAGIKTLLLREDDQFIPLKNRIDLVENSNAQISITIHLNSSADKSRAGYTTFYQEDNPKSELFNHLLHKELNELSLLSDAGSQPGPFYMLSESSVPSVIIDFGYISNPEDVQIILNKGNQIKFAESIVKAIQQYQNI